MGTVDLLQFSHKLGLVRLLMAIPDMSSSPSSRRSHVQAFQAFQGGAVRIEAEDGTCPALGMSSVFLFRSAADCWIGPEAFAGAG